MEFMKEGSFIIIIFLANHPRFLLKGHKSAILAEFLSIGDLGYGISKNVSRSDPKVLAFSKLNINDRERTHRVLHLSERHLINSLVWKG